MRPPLADLIGDCPAIQAVRAQLARLLDQTARAARLPSVLLLGETGTGKGLVARALHHAGPRSAGPFVAVNCAALPAALFEAELFGAVRGAFTGAADTRPGLVRTAHGGTLFLDEIGALAPTLQAKLLTVIETRTVRAVGSTRDDAIDVWLIAATNEDVAEALRSGRLREDLYHRLATVQVGLPPLRERGADILAVARHYLARASTDYGLPPKALDADARAVLLAYAWPGNVRELANVMERAALLTEDRVISAADLALRGDDSASRSAEPSGPLGETVAGFERARLRTVLDEAGGNLSEAARRVGLPRNTLRSRLARLGIRLSEPAPPTGAGRVPLGERLVALLQVTQDTGDPASATVVAPAPALGALADKVTAFGGHVIERDGAGFLAAFGLEPDEDAPSCAAYAALAIQTAARRAARADPTLPPVRMALHGVGLATGPGTADRSEPESPLAPAHPVRLTLGQLRAAAAPDTIRVSDTLVPHIERRFALVSTSAKDGGPPGGRHLVGLEATGLGLGGRRLSRLTGRDRELATLEGLIQQATTGAGQAVVLMGEPGSGKSRLLYEFHRRLVGSTTIWIEGRCVSSGTATPYGPLVEAVRQALGVSEGDDPDVVAVATRERLTTLGVDAAAHAPYLQALLGQGEAASQLSPLSPEAVRLRTFEALHRLFLRLSVTRPLALAVEDLHWIDPTSEAYLTALVDRLAGARMLLLATSRPGAPAPWLRCSHTSQLALPPLSREDSLRVVRSVAPSDRLPDAIAAAIAAKADGNPFFLEELSWAAVTQSLEASAVTAPRSITDVLRARIDRLPETTRRILTVAAVLGREFSTSLLQAVVRDRDTLEPEVRALKRLELLHDQPQVAEPTLVFKHALTQEAVYERLDLAARQGLHAAAGEALEALYAGRLDPVQDRLAYHFARTDRADKAVFYLTRVGDRALRQYAVREAVGAFRDARRHAERFVDPWERDRVRLDLIRREATCRLYAGDFPAVLALITEGQALLDRTDDLPLRGSCYWLLSAASSQLGRHDETRRTARLALETADRCGDRPTTGRTHWVLSMQAYWAGQFRQGLDHGRQGIAALDGTDDLLFLGHAWWGVGINAIALGRFREALAAVRQIQSLADTIGDPALQCYAGWTEGWVHALRGDGDSGIAACERAVRVAPTLLRAAIARMYLGLGHLTHDDDEAVTVLRQAVQELQELRIPTLEAWATGYLAEAHLARHDTRAARELALRAEAAARALGFGYGLGVALRALGCVDHTTGALDEALARHTAALEIFTRIDAAYEVARTQLNLAEVTHAQDSVDATRRYIAAARATFQALDVPRYVERAEELAGRLKAGD
jgi:transcriptional regulator with AAA-type ATPase domain/tetratricopeptide (TPR) repeat protein